MGEPPWLYLNQRGRLVQLFYSKRSSMTYSFKQSGPKCGLVKSSRERYRLLVVGSQNGDSGKNEDVDEPCLESPERQQL